MVGPLPNMCKALGSLLSTGVVVGEGEDKVIFSRYSDTHAPGFAPGPRFVCFCIKFNLLHKLEQVQTL